MAGTMIRRPERASGIPEVLRQPKVLNAKPRFSTEVVIRVGGLPARIPGLALPDPDYVKFDRALQTSVRPVLVSLQRSPFRDFSADEFLGPVARRAVAAAHSREARSRSAKLLTRWCISAIAGRLRISPRTVRS